MFVSKSQVTNVIDFIWYFYGAEVIEAMKNCMHLSRKAGQKNRGASLTLIVLWTLFPWCSPLSLNKPQNMLNICDDLWSSHTVWYRNFVVEFERKSSVSHKTRIIQLHVHYLSFSLFRMPKSARNAGVGFFLSGKRYQEGIFSNNFLAYHDSDAKFHITSNEYLALLCVKFYLYLASSEFTMTSFIQDVGRTQEWNYFLIRQFYFSH